MGAVVTKSCEAITVHRLTPPHHGEPVFYASLPLDRETPKGQGTSSEATRYRLVSTLWHHRAARGHAPVNNSSAPFSLQVVRGLLGRPHLLAGDCRVSISFSEGGGRVWTALSGDGSGIGIDVAGSDEFQGGYPLHRVFHPEELQHALELAGGKVAEAAALLWSVKEAVVKALGCGFHLVDPRQITVCHSTGEGEHTFPVVLSGKALGRFSPAAGRSLWVRSFPQEKMWLAIARLSQAAAP